MQPRSPIDTNSSAGGDALLTYAEAIRVYNRIGGGKPQFVGRGAWARVYRIAHTRVLKVTDDPNEPLICRYIQQWQERGRRTLWAPRIYDVFRVNAKTCGVVCGYVRGAPAKLDESLVLGYRRAEFVDATLGDANEWLYERKLTLHDLGGSNTRVTASGRLVVVDFGVASIDDDNPPTIPELE